MKRIPIFIAVLLIGVSAIYFTERHHDTTPVSANAIVEVAADLQRDLTRLPMRVTRLSDKATKEELAQRRPFTDREIRAILKAASDDPEWYGTILCGLYQGFRLGDVAELAWSDIDLQLAQFRFDTAKTNRAMNVPIAKPLYGYLMKIAGDDPIGPLFPQGLRPASKGRADQRLNQTVPRDHGAGRSS